MSIAIVSCRAQLGLHAPLVHVEVSLGSGLPVFSIVGLPATDVGLLIALHLLDAAISGRS